MKTNYLKRAKYKARVKKHKVKSFFREDISFSCVYEATSGYRNASCFRVNIKESLKNERVSHDNIDIRHAVRLLDTINLIEFHLYESQIRREYHKLNPFRLLESLRRFTNWIPLSIIIDFENYYSFEIREINLEKAKKQVEDIVSKYREQERRELHE